MGWRLSLGYPSLVGIKPSGAREPLAVTHGTYFGNRVPTQLAPGSAAKLYLGTNRGCTALNSPGANAAARANTYTGITITLPDGRGTLGVGHVSLDTACGLSESEIGAAPPVPTSPVAAPGSPASLTAHSTIPAEVHAGADLRYTVTLTNPTATPVSLTPCPVYSESLIGNKTALRMSYQLNCAVVSRIDPGTATTFAMELSVPLSFPSSGAKMFWWLDAPSGPYTGRLLQVVGTSTTTLATGPACEAATLRAAAKGGGAGLGNDLEIVVVTNVGRATCWVGGYPSLVGIKPSGAREPLAVAHGTYFGNRVPTQLAPGSAAKLYLGTNRGCTALNSPGANAAARANTYTGITITLPDGRGTLGVGHVRLDTACGLSESEIGAAPPVPTSGST